MKVVFGNKLINFKGQKEDRELISAYSDYKNVFGDIYNGNTELADMQTVSEAIDGLKVATDSFVSADDPTTTSYDLARRYGLSIKSMYNKLAKAMKDIWPGYLSDIDQEIVAIKKKLYNYASKETLKGDAVSGSNAFYADAFSDTLAVPVKTYYPEGSELEAFNYAKELFDKKPYFKNITSVNFNTDYERKADYFIGKGYFAHAVKPLQEELVKLKYDALNTVNPKTENLTNITRTMQKLASVQVELGEYDKAEDLYSTATELAVRLKDKKILNEAFEKQQDFYFKAIETSEGDEKERYGSLLEGLYDYANKELKG